MQKRDLEMLSLLPRLMEQLEVVSQMENNNMKIFMSHVSAKFILNLLVNKFNRHMLCAYFHYHAIQKDIV